MEGLERFNESPAVTAGELLEKANAENAALRAIIFNIYNGGNVPAEHVALYREIGEGVTPAAPKTVGFTAETAL